MWPKQKSWLKIASRVDRRKRVNGGSSYVLRPCRVADTRPGHLRHLSHRHQFGGSRNETRMGDSGIAPPAPRADSVSGDWTRGANVTPMWGSAADSAKVRVRKLGGPK